MKQLITSVIFRATSFFGFCMLASCASVPYVVPPSGPVNEGLVTPAIVNTPSKLTYPSYTPTLGWFYCAKLTAEPGTGWVVTEKEAILALPTSLRISIGTGRNCANARWLISKDVPEGLSINTKVEFIAGGGNYLILLRDYSGGSDNVNYEITQVDTPTAGFAKLAPGLQDFTVPKGTASTDTGVPEGTRYKPGDTFRDCEHCPEMVALPAGNFFMGSDPFEEGHQTSEGPRHRVIISRAFAIGTKEVTFDEYDACVRDRGCLNVSDRGWGRGRRPVLSLTWAEVMDYVAWLSTTTGQHYFIPSEAEWEYATRAGTDTPWNTGNALISQDANFLNQFQKTVPVGSYAPNGFGLYDTHGNVLEWVQDCMDVGYVGVPTDGSAALGPPCNTRVARGGTYATDHAKTRSAARFSLQETTRYTDTGFRVVRSLPR